MIKWIIILLIVAAAASLLGMPALAGAAATGARILIGIALIVFLLIVLGVFWIFVALYGIGLSFFKIDIGFTTPEFIGLRNYIVLFNQLSYASDSDFWISIVNIIKFTVVVVIGETIIALLMALLLQAVHEKVRGIFRTILYLPAVTSSVAIALIFL